MTDALISREAEERLGILAAEINGIKEQAARTMVAAACEIGKRLVEAKNNLPHGRWGDWLSRNVDYSERTAQQLMKCWEEYGRPGGQALESVAGLTISKAMALLGATKEEREELIENGEAERLSVRELKKRIEELQKLAQVRQVRIDELEEESRCGSGEEQLRARLKVAEGEAGRLARELDDMRERAEQEKRSAAGREEAARKAAEEWEKRARAAEEREPVIREVERMPEETAEEMERLREAVRRAPNEHAVRARAIYERILEEWGALKRELAAMEDGEAAKYRAAFAKAMRIMAEAMEGEKE